MGIRWSNNASTTLTASVTTSQTSITVANGSLFPTITGSDYFYLTLGSLATGTEIVKCTARNVNVLTIVRAQEGTTALAFASGDYVELRVTAAGLTALSNPDITTSANLTPVDADTPVPAFIGPSYIVGAINSASQALLNKLTYAIARVFPSFTGNAGKVLTVNAGATGVEWQSLPAQAYVPIGSYLPFSRNDVSFTDNGATWLRSGVTTLSSVYPSAPSRTLHTGDSITTHTAPASNVNSVAVNNNTVILAVSNSSTGYRSTDGGLTFSTITYPISIGSFPCIGYVGSSLWLVCNTGSQYFYCYESTNDGTSWTNRTVATSIGFVPSMPIMPRMFAVGTSGYIYINDSRFVKVTNGVNGATVGVRPGTASCKVSWYDGTYYCMAMDETIGGTPYVYQMRMVRTTDFTNFQTTSAVVSSQYYLNGLSINGTAPGIIVGPGAGTYSLELVTSDGVVTQLKSTTTPPINAAIVGTEYFYNVSSKLWRALDITQTPTNPTSTSIGTFSFVWSTPAAGVCFYGSSIWRTLPTATYVDNLSANFADYPVNSKPFYMRVA